MVKKTFKLTKEDIIEIVKNALDEYVKIMEKSHNPIIISNSDDVPDATGLFGGYDDDDFINNCLKDIVNEGLIRTYDVNKVRDIFCRRFNLDPVHFQLKEFNRDGVILNIPIIILPTTTDKETVGKIKHFMQTCGYHLSQNAKPMYDGKYMAYLFEPKFSKEVTDKIRENYQFLYHATPTVLLGKILKKGLAPQEKNAIFFYPSRVYCMKGNDLDETQISELKNVQKARLKKVDLSKNDNNEYTILRIDISKLPENIQFYVDPMASQAIYTYNNIPPQALTILGKL
jgi:hypothetical protein